MMQNRLFLSSYLLSGDTREVDRMKEGERQLNEKLQDVQRLASDQEREELEKVQRNESMWATDFAAALIEKRKQVDAGNSTVAELQIFYLQKDASSWVKNSTDPLDAADHENKKVLDESRASDETASAWTIGVALLSTLIALALGIAIAYRSAKSITDPLNS
jgi:CHASE3 domain sensor protein